MASTTTATMAPMDLYTHSPYSFGNASCTFGQELRGGEKSKPLNSKSPFQLKVASVTLAAELSIHSESSNTHSEEATTEVPACASHHSHPHSESTRRSSLATQSSSDSAAFATKNPHNEAIPETKSAHMDIPVSQASPLVPEGTPSSFNTSWADMVEEDEENEEEDDDEDESEAEGEEEESGDGDSLPTSPLTPYGPSNGFHPHFQPTQYAPRHYAHDSHHHHHGHHHHPGHHGMMAMTPAPMLYGYDAYGNYIAAPGAAPGSCNCGSCGCGSTPAPYGMAPVPHAYASYSAAGSMMPCSCGVPHAPDFRTTSPYFPNNNAMVPGYGCGGAMYPNLAAPGNGHRMPGFQHRKRSERRVLQTTPCIHVTSWKRLRAKRGYGYYVCQFCGAKWKTCSTTRQRS